jgi:uncharacterized membrane protein YidH (DUF202 family)
MPIQAQHRPQLPLLVVLVAFAGALSALAGAWWDDAWHTERGRDEFFIAPHIAIYAGIAASGGALSLWALLTARTHGTRAVWRHKPLTLALLSVVVTLASGPIDNAWHVAFGRDSVIWSPPHMLGIAGTLALGAAILAELAGRPERWARPLAVVAGALVLASATFATAEYETDVPQFDEVFYLPVLGFAAGIALVLIRTAADARWAATISALAYTVFIGLVAGFLALVGFPPPALPLLAVPALIVDLAHSRRWPASLTATLYTVALHLAYVPVRNLIGDGVRFDAEDVLLGAALTWAATYLIFRVTDEPAAPERLRARAPLATAGAAALLLALAVAAPALAHDPGQGEEAGTVALRISVDGADRARLTAGLPADVCARTEPEGVVARRAGEIVRGPLTKRDCELRGTLDLPERGRWFVYAQMRRDGQPVESWLPIDAGFGPTSVGERGRYAYIPPQRASSAIKLIAGVLLYGGMLALLYATFRLIRASRRERGPSLRPAGAP